VSPVVELRNVSFVRDGRRILDDVSFAVEAGEHWALLGPNGAGKSTILGFCGALTHPTTGTVHVLDGQLGRTELQALRRSIGHVNPRHPLRSPLTVLEVVLTGLTGTIETPMRWEPTTTQIAQAEGLLASLGLAGLGSARWPNLSQGERGRTLIARALVSEPRLLLLDEPSTGLDVAARERLLETIDTLEQSHPEVASILVTHHLEELPSTTTHAMLVSHGRLVASGPVHEVVNTATVTAAFEHPIDVEFRDGRWGARARRR
jgi:iron complex transport system ATP-binding protein